MGFILEGAGLKPNSALVDSSGRLMVSATSTGALVQASEERELAFTWSNVPYSYANGDTILLLKNTSPNKHLHITRISGSSDTTTQVIVHFPVSITPAGTPVEGTNLNRTSGKVAAAIAMADETNNSIGDVLARAVLMANVTAGFSNEGAIILGNNDQIAIDFVTAGTACNVNITGYFDDIVQ